MLRPPKKVWNRFASKVISKLGRFLGRFGTAGEGGGRRCCRCSCHYVVTGDRRHPEYWLQVNRSFWNSNHHHDEGDGNGDEGLEYVEEDHAVDEKAEEFIAKFHQSLKLEKLQHF